jgi:hypothetical protein
MGDRRGKQKKKRDEGGERWSGRSRGEEKARETGLVSPQEEEEKPGGEGLPGGDKWRGRRGGRNGRSCWRSRRRRRKRKKEKKTKKMMKRRRETKEMD